TIDPAARSAPVTTLRLGILGLLRRAAPRALRRRLLDRAQARLQVVEDEADGGLGTRRRRNRPLAVPNDEDAPDRGRGLELGHPRPDPVGLVEQAAGPVEQALRRLGGRV